MGINRNPAGQGGASDGSVHAVNLNTSDHKQAPATHQALFGSRPGSDTGSAAGGPVRGRAPFIELCCQLVEVGYRHADARLLRPDADVFVERVRRGLVSRFGRPMAPIEIRAATARM